jgi:hypothetical protein
MKSTESEDIASFGMRAYQVGFFPMLIHKLSSGTQGKYYLSTKLGW